MNIVAAFNEVGTYRGAAAVCGCDPKTMRRTIERLAAGSTPPRGERAHNYDVVRDVVAKRIGSTKARISAKRLLPEARAAGFAGSARNFRRLVARAKSEWRRDNHRAAARRCGRRARRW